MLYEFHSAFLQALGYAIVNSLWQFALLWLLYVVLTTVFKMTSHHRYNSGVVVQMAGCVWFFLTVTYYYIQSSQADFIDNHAGVASGASGFREKIFLVISNGEQFLPYLSIAYITLLVFLIAKWIFTYRNAQLVKKNCIEKIEIEWRLFVQKISQRLGLKRKVNIYVSTLVNTPLTIGFFKPVILIPFASLNHLSVEQMEAVLLHELAHIKRFDYLVNLFLAFVETALFFNPFMQLISKQIKKERENCCDDWVLQFQYKPETYAKALLTIARFETIAPAFALKATDNRNLLLNRVRRILERKENTLFSYRQQLIALLTIASVYTLISILSEKDFIKKNKTPYTVTKAEPLAAKVRNPLFSPLFFLAEDEGGPEPRNAKNISDNGRKVTFTPSAKVVARNEDVAETIEPFTPVDIAIPALLKNEKLNEDITTEVLQNQSQMLNNKALSEILQKEASCAKEAAMDERKRAIIAMKTAIMQLKLSELKMSVVQLTNLVPAIVNSLNKDISKDINEKDFIELQTEIAALSEKVKKQIEKQKQETLYLNTVASPESLPAVYYAYSTQEGKADVANEGATAEATAIYNKDHQAETKLIIKIEISKPTSDSATRRVSATKKVIKTVKI